MMRAEAGGKSAVFKRMIEVKVDAGPVMAHPFPAIVNVRRFRVPLAICKMVRWALCRWALWWMSRMFWRSRLMLLRVLAAVWLLPGLRSAGRDVLPPAAHFSASVLLTPLGCQRS